MSLIDRIFRRDAGTRKRGVAAELLAERYLTARGLIVEARNYRVRGGEIDLVCRDGESLVFVEVRLRSHVDYGGADTVEHHPDQATPHRSAATALPDGAARNALSFRLCGDGHSGGRPD